MKLYPAIKKPAPFLLFILVPLIVFSCDDDPSNTDDSAKLNISIVSGNNQTDRSGSALDEPLTVQVTNIIGATIPGVTVQFDADVQDAVVSPGESVTDNYGLTSCTLRLGSQEGEYRLIASIADDSVAFTATAVPVGCNEENPARVCEWPAGHIFVTTTSSSLLNGSVSVLLDVDPETDNIDRVLGTNERIIDLAFSSRGELFVATDQKIFKVDPDTKTLVEFGTYPEEREVELEPNEGGIMAGLSVNNIFSVECAPDIINDLMTIASTFYVKWENLAVDPVTRDLYLIGGQSNYYTVYAVTWDGRSSIPGSLAGHAHAGIANVNATPTGMCADSTGTVYIILDSTDETRKIVSVAPGGTVSDLYSFFPGMNTQAAGRWGDITCLDGNLFMIDKRNDRLVVISKNGTWVKAIENGAFSEPFMETERYGIAASPAWTCD